MNYLLDTNICVYFMRGKRNVAAKISEIGQEHFFISEMTWVNYIGGDPMSGTSYQIIKQTNE